MYYRGLTDLSFMIFWGWTVCGKMTLVVVLSYILVRPVHMPDEAEITQRGTALCYSQTASADLRILPLKEYPYIQF